MPNQILPFPERPYQLLLPPSHLFCLILNAYRQKHPHQTALACRRQGRRFWRSTIKLIIAAYKEGLG
jgi:hypothetical protein